jgi:hypothetical protein
MKWLAFFVLGVVTISFLLWPNCRCGHRFTENRAIAKNNLAAIARALEEYSGTHGGLWPADLSALLDQGDGVLAHLVGYTQAPRDPWNREFLYERKVDGLSWRLSSLGSDGKLGGWGDARDIVIESK